MIFILDSRSYIVYKAVANLYSWNHLIIPILFLTFCNIQNNQIIKYFKYIQGKLLLLPSKIFCLLDSFQQLHYNYRKSSNIPLPFQTENKNSLYEQFHTIDVVMVIDSEIFSECLELLTNVSLKHLSFPNTWKQPLIYPSRLPFRSKRFRNSSRQR